MDGALIQPAAPNLPGLTGAPATPRSALAPDRGFGMTLGSALRPVSDEVDARKAAEEFVAVAFVEPILKSLRESNQAAPPFAPTEAEKSFGPLLDAELSRRIVAKERYGLVDTVARRLLNASEASRTTPSRVDLHG